MRIEAPVRRRNLISLTPLIDVVFILLVFFMLASSFLDWRGITLDMPAPELGLHSDRSLEVRLGADGSLRLDGDRLGREALLERIAAAVAADPTRPVIVRPAASVQLQEMVELVERLTAVGVANVSLRQE